MFHIKDCILYGYDLYGGDIRVQTANNYKECNRKCRIIQDPNLPYACADFHVDK